MLVARCLLMTCLQKKDPDAVRRLIQHCANVNAATHQNNSPLHLAARLGNSHIAKLLAELGNACVYGKNVTGMSPLHIAAKHGHADLVKYFVRLFTVYCSIALLLYCRSAFSVVLNCAITDLLR